MDCISIISGAFTKEILTWLKAWPFLFPPQQVVITLSLRTHYKIFFCFLQEAFSDCPQPWSSPYCASCQWGHGQLILQYGGMTWFTSTLSPPMERVPCLCCPQILSEWMLRKGVTAQLVGHFWLEGWPRGGDLHLAVLIKDCGPWLTVNAPWDLFLDCNLTPIFQLSWYRLATQGILIRQKPNYFLSLWYLFPSSQSQRTVLHLICGVVPVNFY